MSNTNNNNNKKKKVWFRCSDQMRVDVVPLHAMESEALKYCFWYGEYGVVPIKIKSSIVEKALDFCKTRAEMKKKHGHDQNLVKEMLKDFDSQFLKQNHSDAIDLISAAIKLEIKSLLYLLLDDVIDMFTKKTDKEIYNFLQVNLEEYDSQRFEMMKEILHDSDWPLQPIM